MLQELSTLPIYIQYGLLSLFGLVIFWIGFKFGKIVVGSSSKKQGAAFEKEIQVFQKNMKKMYDSEVKQLKEKNQKLENTIQINENLLEDYRRKISGLGLLSFSGNKKRADILYSLLLENEALEQLLHAHGTKLVDQQQQHLQEKLMDIRKRQRLLAEIFNDDTIKNYVSETLEDQKNIQSLSPIESSANPK